MRKCGIFSKLNMSILNHGLKTTLRSIFATVIAVMAICGGIETAHAANWMACSSCAKGDYFGGDGYCQIELKDQCGGTLTNCYFDDESGQVSCSGIPSAPACKCSDKGSGWTGSCSGSNYSTCYKSCSVSCLNAGGLDTTACKNSIAYGNGWIDCNDSSNYTVVNVTGTQYYGGSCSSNTKCAFYNLCGANCPSGYTAGGAQYNSCKYTANDACYKTCTRACTQTGCPSGYSCTYNSSSTSGKQYYNSSTCDAASSNCSIKTQTCNTLCSAVSNTTSTQSCTRSCSIANGTCSYSGSKQTCNGKYTNSACQSAGASCSGCSSWGTCGGGTISITCNAGYYLSNGSCVPCETGYYCPGNNNRTACSNKPANSGYTGSSTSNSCPWSCNAGYYGSSANGNTSCANCGSGYYCTGGTHRASCASTVPSSSPSASAAYSLNDWSWSGYENCPSADLCICDWYFSDSTRWRYLNQSQCMYGPSGNNYTVYYWCNTGYYAADPLGWGDWYTSCKSCTNKPANSYYTSYSTPSSMYAVESNCPWACNANYYKSGSSCAACSGVSFTDTGSDTETITGGSRTRSKSRTCYRTTSAAGSTSSSACSGSGNCGGWSYGDWTVTCSAGYYKSGDLCAKCESGYYCPGDNSRYGCPSPSTYAPNSFSSSYYSPTISSYSLSSGAGTTSADSCQYLYWYTSSRGDFYEYTNYSSSIGRYKAVAPQGWSSVKPGYYLKDKAACGYYAYYLTPTTCPAGYYCPGKSGVVCDGSNQSTVHTTNFGLNSCPSGYPNSGAGSDAASDCYTSCTKACTQQSCPSNATCTHGSTSTTGTQYYDGSCSAPASTCSITVTCNAGYYLSNGTCVPCANGTYSSAGATSCTACTGLPSNAEWTGSATSNACPWRCNAGYYLSNGTCAKCEAGYYCPGNNSRGQCTGATYQDETGKTSCKSCPTATKYASMVSYYWYWSSDGVNDHLGGCRAEFNENDSNGNYALSCNYNSGDYGVTGSASDSNCMANPTTCIAGKYAPNGTGGVWTGTVELMKSTACVDVGTGYWSGADSLTRTACTNKPANSYYTGSGGGSNACGWACNANYYKSGSSCAACSDVSFTDTGTDTETITGGSRTRSKTRTCYRTTSDAGSTSSSACTGTASCGDWSYGAWNATCSTGYTQNANDDGCNCNTNCTAVSNTSSTQTCERSCSIANGTCSYSGSTQTCNGKYTNSACQSAGATCSGCSSWGTCDGGTISITCNAGYYLSNGSCVKCESGYYCTGNNNRTSCPSGYGSSAAGSTKEGDCYTSCSKACTQTGCPSGYTCTYKSSSTSGTQYYGGSCSAAASTCEIATQTCNTLCSAVSNTTSTQSCTRSCSIANGTCSYSGSTQTCNGKYTNSACQSAGATCSGCSSWGTCGGGTISITCNAGYYLSNGACKQCESGYYCTGNNNRTSCPSGYGSSAAGSTKEGDCYTTVTRGCTQNNGSTPSGCASVTAWNACSCAGGTYVKYANGTTSGTTSNETCIKKPKTVTANANNYVSGATCPTCSSYSSTYTLSDGGSIGSSSCYTNITRGCTQNNGSTPSGCASVTAWNACSCDGTTYRKYASGSTSGTTSNETCTKKPKTVTANSGNYVSGTTCPACPTAYPSSDGGNIGEGNCYVTKTNTGTQTACSKPANSATYACGTCTPGTCDWRDYKSATDTSCTPGNCTQPVNPGSVVCNTGYYKDGVSCPACTNKPSNSSYTGTASSNSCPWSCNSGYNLTSDNQCGQFCGSGITHIHLSTGLKIPLYATARTAPAINVKWNDTICYGSLATGAGSGLNVNYNGTTYHAVE